jgi:hypothetical protein
MATKIVTTWQVKSCGLVDIYRRFGETFLPQPTGYHESNFHVIVILANLCISLKFMFICCKYKFMLHHREHTKLQANITLCLASLNLRHYKQNVSKL